MDYTYDRAMGRNIKRIREKTGLTQDQLAARLQTLGCDITRSALAKIEAGQRHLYSWEIHALKKALDVPYDELFI
jgi:transcriptional regulator with XRE-family HTH domain